MKIPGAATLALAIDFKEKIMSVLKVYSAYKPDHLIAELPRINREEAYRKLQRAQDYFLDRQNWLPAHERIRILKIACRLVNERSDELAKQAALEGGKPLVDSKVELARAVNGIEVAIQEMNQLTGEEVKMGVTSSSANKMAFTRYEPCGVVLAISAFNHPFNLIVHQVIPAIAAGSPCLVRPASSTPLSCVSLVEILHEAGIPQELCTLLLCEREVAQEIVSDPRIRFMSFIGSAEVGFHLNSKLSPGAKATLEHGGVAPVILCEDANLKEAVPGLLKASFYHAGQVCVSAQRIYIHENRKNEFLDDFVRAAKELRTGDPLSEETEVGPIISKDEIERIDQWVQEAIELGGELLCGGNRLGESCYESTVILNPPQNCKLSQFEIFGPVVAVYSYDELDSAFSQANALPYCFQASLYTESYHTAMKASTSLKAMTVLINEHPAFRVDWMPFGGSEKSGLGMGGIGNSIRDMSLEKLIIFHSSELPS